MRRTAHIIIRFSRLVLLKPQMALLKLRMAGWLIILSLGVRFLSLPETLRLITPRKTRSAKVYSTEPLAYLEKVVDSLLKINSLFLNPICWKRAALLYRYLMINGLHTQIIFGVRKEDQGQLTGHAWLELQGQPIFETSLPNYKPVYSYPPKVSLEKILD